MEPAAVPASAPEAAPDGLPDTAVCSCATVCSGRRPVLLTPAGQRLPQRVFFCLPLRSRLRQAAVAVTFDPAFEPFILLAILTNCFFMAGFKELEAQTEIYFVIIFTLEMALKMLTFGFASHRMAYLRSGWNVLDFIIVISGVAVIVAKQLLEAAEQGTGTANDIGAISTLRAIRVLRPLRTISRVPSMRVLVGSLIDAVPQLAGVLLLFLFFLLTFGVVGIQLFSGALHHRCYEDEPSPAMVQLQSAALCLGAASAAAAANCTRQLGPLPMVVSGFAPGGFGGEDLKEAPRVHELALRWSPAAGGLSPPMSIRVWLSQDNVSWSSYTLWPAGNSSGGSGSSSGGSGSSSTTNSSISSSSGGSILSSPPLRSSFWGRQDSSAPPPPALPAAATPSAPPPSCDDPPPAAGRQYAAKMPNGGVRTRWLRIDLNTSSCAGDGSDSSGSSSSSSGSSSSASGGGLLVGLRVESLALTASMADPISDTEICCDPVTHSCSAEGLCFAGQRCLWDAHHPNGVNSFDNMGWALLTIFQSMVCDTEHRH